jgi:hypothetical protein
VEWNSGFQSWGGNLSSGLIGRGRALALNFMGKRCHEVF